MSLFNEVKCQPSYICAFLYLSSLESKCNVCKELFYYIWSLGDNDMTKNATDGGGVGGRREIERYRKAAKKGGVGGDIIIYNDSARV